MNIKRTIHLITHLTAVTILASYSAALIRFLAVETVHLPFTTMRGLIDDNTYKMGIYIEADYVLLKVMIFRLIYCM